MRHDPLEKQMRESNQASEGYLKAPKQQGRRDEKSERERPMTEKESQRILREVHAQQKEIAAEDEATQVGQRAEERKARFLSISDFKGDSDDEDPLDDAYEEEYEDVELTAEDEKALAMFMPSSNVSGGSQGRTIADLIMDAIAKHDQGQMEADSVEDDLRTRLDPTVVEVYTGVAKYFLHYTSGKIPKAFKIVPNLKNWEEIVYLTNPDKWTPQATYVAVKLFASNLKPRAAQRFFNIILLPRVRADIEDHQRLNYHLYRSIQKSIYKPAAFFKGILLPLAADGCSPKEAVVMSSILAKSTIPVPHSAVALLKLSELEYSGPTLLFMKTLINKKYSLPFKVVDALVLYFAKSANDERDLPVVWHQALLTFVQRYKHYFKPAQKRQLNTLLSSQSHRLITQEIRRELNAQAPMNARQRQQRELEAERNNRMQIS